MYVYTVSKLADLALYKKKMFLQNILANHDFRFFHKLAVSMVSLI